MNFKINKQQIYDYLNSRHFIIDNNTFYKKIKLLDGAFLYSKILQLTNLKNKILTIHLIGLIKNIIEN